MRCPRCGVDKPNSDFPRNRASRTGYNSYCKPCHNIVTRENRIKHHGSTRQFHLVRRYGVTEADVAWRVLQQGGVCAVCREGLPEHVDHDHATGEVRGITCFNCNRALGYVDDDLMRLYALADYLEGTATT